MPFKMTNEARSFFRYLEKESDFVRLDTIFDQYYLCLMVGLLNQRLGSSGDEGTDFIQDFPDDWYPRRHEILGLLIATELNRKGVGQADRHSLETLVLKYVNHQSSTNLSLDGMTLLNRYAKGGFEILSERFKDPPRSVHTFLIEYLRLVGGSVDQEPAEKAA